MKQLKQGEKIYGIKPLPKGLASYKPDSASVCPATIKALKQLLIDYVKHNRSVFDGNKGKYKDTHTMFVFSWMIGEIMFPDNEQFSWDLVTERGTLSRRISAHFYRKFKIKLPTDIMQKIGAVIASSVISTKEYSIDIVKDFNWERGDFGDSGSCFWGGRVGIRKDMENAGFKALRFFVKDFTGLRPGTSRYYKDLAGIGRSWLWKTVIREKNDHAVIGNEVYVIFNGYGPNTQWQAKFLSTYLNLPMKAIALSNHSKKSGGLFVNDDIGYIIGERKIIQNVKKLDFNVKETIYIKAGNGDELTNHFV